MEAPQDDGNRVEEKPVTKRSVDGVIRSSVDGVDEWTGREGVR